MKIVSMLIFNSCVAASICLCSTTFAALEVYLPLDGNALDASGKGRNGVLVNGAAGTNAYVAAKAGQGIEFGLTAGNTVANAESTFTGNDYVRVNYTLPNTGTIAIWKKKADFNYNYESVWDNSGTSSLPADNWECWMDNWGGYLHARAPDGVVGNWGSDDASVNVHLSEAYDSQNYFGEWMHITVTWEKLTASTMEMRMYLNGELKDTALAMAWQNPGSMFYLAGGHDENTAGIGIFDELAIWSEELSDADVMDVYLYGVTGDLLPSIPGDADRNGEVNADDAAVLSENWLAGGANWLMGDFNRDGIVNDSDAVLMAANWGKTAASAAVPEPSAVCILLGVLISLALLRFRRR